MISEKNKAFFANKKRINEKNIKNNVWKREISENTKDINMEKNNMCNTYEITILIIIKKKKKQYETRIH